MNKRLKWFLKLFFGFLLLAFAVWKAGIDKLLDLKLEIPLFILSLTLVPIFLIMKTIKWRRIINIKAKVPFLECFRMYIIGLFFGSITPSRIGELSRAYHLTKLHRFPIGHSTASVVIDRVMELLALALLAVIGAFFFKFKYSRSLSIFNTLLILFILIFILMIIFVLLSIKFQFWVLSAIKKNRKPLAKLLFKMTNRKIDVYRIINETFIFLRNIKNNPSLLWGVFFISILIWIFDFIYTYIIIRSLGGMPPFSYMFVLVPISAIISLIPISISGLGTREVTFIYLLSFVGVEESIAFISSFLIAFLNIWLPAIIGGVFYLVEKLMRMKE